MQIKNLFLKFYNEYEHTLNFLSSNLIILFTNFALTLFLINNFIISIYSDILILKISILAVSSICSLGFNQSFTVLIKSKINKKQNEFQSFNSLVSILFSIPFSLLFISYLGKNLNTFNSLTSLVFILSTVMSIASNDLLNRHKSYLDSFKYFFLVFQKNIIVLFLILKFLPNFENIVLFYFIIYISADIYIIIFSSIFFKSNIFKLKFNSYFFYTSLKNGFLLNFVNFLYISIQYIDRYILNYFSDDISLAKYDINMIYAFSILGIISKSFHQFIFTKISSKYHKNKYFYDQGYISKNYKTFIFATILIFLLLILFYDFYINIFDNYEFKLNFIELSLLIIACFFFHSTNFTFAKNYLDKTYKVIIKKLLFIFLLNLIFSSYLTYYYDLSGLILSVLIVNFMLYVISSINSRK